MESQPPVLIEIAWEVAQKIGGIYTVIRTKVPFMIDRWGENYALVGIYNASTASTEFEPAEPPPLFSTLIYNYQKRHPHSKVHFGRWLVSGVYTSPSDCSPAVLIPIQLH
jgi:glycogen synthase